MRKFNFQLNYLNFNRAYSIVEFDINNTNSMSIFVLRKSFIRHHVNPTSSSHSTRHIFYPFFLKHKFKVSSIGGGGERDGERKHMVRGKGFFFLTTFFYLLASNQLFSVYH